VLVNEVMQAHRKLGHLRGKQLYQYLRRNGIVISQDNVFRIIGDCACCGVIKMRFRDRGPPKDLLSEDLTADEGAPLQLLVKPGEAISFDFAFLKGGVVKLLIVDRISTKVFADEVKSKREAYDLLRQYYYTELEVHGYPIKRFHSDSEKVLHAKRIKRFIQRKNIEQTMSGPNDKSRNGQCESEVKLYKRGIKCGVYDMPPGAKQPKKELAIIARTATMQRNLQPKEKFNWKCAYEMHYPEGHFIRQNLAKIKRRLLPIGTEVVVPTPTDHEPNIVGYFLGLKFDVSGIGSIIRNAKTGCIVVGVQARPIRRVPIGARPTKASQDDINSGGADDEISDDVGSDDKDSECDETDESEAEVIEMQSLSEDSATDEDLVEKFFADDGSDFESDDDVSYASADNKDCAADSDDGEFNEDDFIAEEAVNVAIQERFKVNFVDIGPMQGESMFAEADEEFIRIANISEDEINTDDEQQYRILQSTIRHLADKHGICLADMGDRDGILAIAAMEGWRLENLVDGLGIDANLAIASMNLIPARNAYEEELRKRAAFKEIYTLLSTGAVRRSPERFKKGEVETIPMQSLMDRKTKKDGSLDKLKARYCISGNREKPGVHYDPHRSWTTMVSAFGVLLALLFSMHREVPIWVRDFMEAFLRTKRSWNEIRTFINALYGILGLEPDEVMEIEGFVYGSHMSGAKFQQQLNWVFDWTNFQQVDIFDQDFRMDEFGNIVTTHVDDTMYVPSKQGMAMLMDKLHRISTIYPMTEGDPEFLLGVNRKFCPNFSFVKCYTTGTLEEAARKYCVLEPGCEAKQCSVPISPDSIIDAVIPDSDEEENPVGVDYRGITGAIGWPVQHQFPAIKGYHSYLSSYNCAYTKRRFEEARTCLRWLFEHRDDELRLNRVDLTKAVFRIYCDASAANERTGKTRIAWYCFIGDGDNWSCVASRVSIVNKVKTATYGFEIRCISEGFDRGMAMYRMAKAAGIDFVGPPEFIGDNEALMKVIAGGALKENSRTLKMKHWMIRTAFFNGRVRIGWIEGKRNPADIGTKLVDKTTFERHYPVIQFGEGVPEPNRWFDLHGILTKKLAIIEAKRLAAREL